jgi:hypothetical protein
LSFLNATEFLPESQMIVCPRDHKGKEQDVLDDERRNLGPSCGIAPLEFCVCECAHDSSKNNEHPTADDETRDYLKEMFRERMYIIAVRRPQAALDDCKYDHTREEKRHRKVVEIIVQHDKYAHREVSFQYR